jgi:hypothetical protein
MVGLSGNSSIRASTVPHSRPQQFLSTERGEVALTLQTHTLEFLGSNSGSNINYPS